MAKRHVRYAPFHEYQPLHITGTGTAQAVGAQVVTTATTAIAAAGSVVITPASMTNIVDGMLLNISGGTGTAEDVVVTNISPTTFTATFQNTHSGTYNVLSYKATFMQGLSINQSGSSVTLTLYNGNPNAKFPGTTNAVGVAFAVIAFSTALTAPTYVALPGVADKGLFYTLAATGTVDYTIWYADEY
jgi:hypothetical protein